MLKIVSANGVGLISDSGRTGWRGQGVCSAGAIDQFSFRVANRALGNEAGAAALELLGQFDLVCSRPIHVMLATRAALVTVNKQPVPSGRVLQLEEGDIVRCTSTALASWVILCIRGGVLCEPVLGSRSAHLPSGLGPAVLRPGFVIEAGQAQVSRVFDPNLTLAMPHPEGDQGGATYTGGNSPVLALRVSRGPELEQLPESEQEKLFAQAWRVALNSNRQGYRLDASALDATCLPQMDSHPVLPGYIQCPPSGLPILLMADAQVTGGYPRLGAVVHADLWRLAFLSPGKQVKFIPLTDEQVCNANAIHRKQIEKYERIIDTHLVEC